MVKNRVLLLIAGIVWLIAGVNIARIGLLAYTGNLSLLRLVCSVLIYFAFWLMVFKKLVVKHTVRIHQYETEKQYFWNFFDLKSFCIMAFMMTLGIVIRSFFILCRMYLSPSFIQDLVWR